MKNHFGWLKLCAIVLAMTSWGLIRPELSWADIPPLSLSSTNPINGATGLAVDVVAEGITINHMLVNSSAPQVYCWPVISTITDQTVKLSETANPSIVHPFYTASWQKPSTVPTPSPTTVSKGWFSLRNVQPGYQLKAHTSYTLWLKGGHQGIRFACNDSQFTYLSDANNSMQFTTGADTIPPLIVNPTAAASLNNAQVRWTTAELTTGRVEYGPTTAYGRVAASSTAIQDHVVSLADLQPGTTYYYRITSTDQASPSNKSQWTGSFSTWSMGEVKVSQVTGHEATIAWTSSVPTDSMVEYGSTASLGLRSGGKDLVQQHNVRLVHLKSNTTYYFHIRATNENGVAVTQQLRFATRDALAGPSPDVITFNPQIVGAADEWSRFNLLDFPPDSQASASADQTSSGAVLAAQDQTDSPLAKVSAKAGQLVQEHGQWLWYIVILLLVLGAVIAAYLYFRHDVKMNNWRLQLKKSQVQPK